MSRRHVVLVGLPGSGKSTAGREAARMLHSEFTDIDAEIEREAGERIADLFARAGEPEFRRLEAIAMARALALPARVLAPGAGWIAQPGNLEASRAGVLIYLAVEPAVAARRLAGDITRPLLKGDDLLRRLGELLADRERWYRRAAAEVDASREPETVAAAVAAVARRLGGW